MNIEHIKDYVYYEDNSDLTLRKSVLGTCAITFFVLMHMAVAIFEKFYALSIFLAVFALASVVIYTVLLIKHREWNFSDRLICRGTATVHMGLCLFLCAVLFIEMYEKSRLVFLLCILCAVLISVTLFHVITVARIKKGAYSKDKSGFLWELLYVPAAVAGYFLAKAVLPSFEGDGIFYLMFTAYILGGMLGMSGLKHLVRYYLYKKYFAGVE